MQHSLARFLLKRVKKKGLNGAIPPSPQNGGSVQKTTTLARITHIVFL